MNKNRFGMLLALVLMILISACGNSSEESSNNSGNESTAIVEDLEEDSTETDEEAVAIQIKGDMAISGSNVLSPLTEAVVAKFGETYPDVAIAINDSDDDSFVPFCTGESSYHQATRVINEEEKPACETNMIEYKEIQVAGGKDGSNQPLYFYVSLDVLSGMEGYEFASLYLQETPLLAEQLGYTPMPQTAYDEGLAKLDE
jgi:ABC-type phosphate transport system substrate-binding protein